MRTFLLILFLAFNCAHILARPIYVNNVNGDDAQNGTTQKHALRTFKKAVQFARPGDTIHIMNTGLPYKESLVLHDKSGTADSLIVVEGNGSIISGSETLNIAEWQKIEEGLYVNRLLYAERKFNFDVVRRYYFLFDGKMNRMGRCLKGKNIPFKKPGELLTNEWTFVEAENAFYLKTNSQDANWWKSIQHPLRSNGVAISGSTSYLVIKNLICTNLYNDGFGITGTAKEIVFENIQSLYNGDDGISAHADCSFKVNGFISVGNGTGICDTGNSNTEYSQIFMKDNVGVDLYFFNERKGTAFHAVKSGKIIAGANKSLVFHAELPESSLQVQISGLEIEYTQVSDLNIYTKGDVKLSYDAKTIRSIKGQ